MEYAAGHSSMRCTLSAAPSGRSCPHSTPFWPSPAECRSAPSPVLQTSFPAPSSGSRTRMCPKSLPLPLLPTLPPVVDPPEHSNARTPIQRANRQRILQPRFHRALEILQLQRRLRESVKLLGSFRTLIMVQPRLTQNAVQ